MAFTESAEGRLASATLLGKAIGAQNCRVCLDAKTTARATTAPAAAKRAGTETTASLVSGFELIVRVRMTLGFKFLDGCPNSCNQHGQCQKFGDAWRCLCSGDFTGEDCGVPLERQCSDGVDNDGGMAYWIFCLCWMKNFAGLQLLLFFRWPGRLRRLGVLRHRLL